MAVRAILARRPLHPLIAGMDAIVTSRNAKIFTIGRSQAVTLPAQFPFEGSEAFVRREAMMLASEYCQIGGTTSALERGHSVRRYGVSDGDEISSVGRRYGAVPG